MRKIQYTLNYKAICEVYYKNSELLNNYLHEIVYLANQILHKFKFSDLEKNPLNTETFSTRKRKKIIIFFKYVTYLKINRNQS